MGQKILIFVSLRYIGKVRRLIHPDCENRNANVLFVEAIARTIKSIFRQRLRWKMRKLKIVGEQPYKKYEN